MTTTTASPKHSGSTARRSSRRLGLYALLGGPWILLLTFLYRDSGSDRAMAVPLSATAATASTPRNNPATTQSADVTEGNVGPWGKLQYVPIALEMPADYETVAQAVALHDRWAFAFRNRDQAIELMTQCGVSADQLALLPPDAWQQDDHAATVAPPDAFLLGLSSDTRSKLYTRLMEDPANDLAIDPIWFRKDRVEFRLRGSDLSDASIGLLKRLLYPGPDDMLLFNELKPAIRSISDPLEQARFLKAVERKRSLMARLYLTPESDTAALANYWGKGGREANLLPLLDSMKFNAVAGVENPSRINILSLLPPFVQQRLYRHAELVVPAGQIPEDCFWTAFNFFNAEPDERVHELDYFTAMLDRDYEKIDHPSQLGDVVMVLDERGAALHVANYIADNIVFTKNGYNGGAPWILAPMRDVIDTYRIKHDPVSVAYFRKRGTTRP